MYLLDLADYEVKSVSLFLLDKYMGIATLQSPCPLWCMISVAVFSAPYSGVCDYFLSAY